MKNLNFPLISVILPVYNVSPYIKEAIDSILNQTFSDFELIIIDDCSTDATLDIVHQYNDDRIKIITKEKNKGLIDSLNFGISIAKGKYLARMDGDDISLPERFAKQVDFLEKNSNIIMCGTAYKTFGAIEKEIRHPSNHEKISVGLCISSTFGHPTIMGRKQIFEKLKYNKKFEKVEDYELWSRLIFEGQVANLDEVLLFYRVHENQVSTLFNDVQRIKNVEIQLFLLKKTGYNTIVFADDYLKKMLYLKEYFTVGEFRLFLKWLKEIYKLNKRNKVYASQELEKILNSIRKGIIYKIYFHSNFCGIDKKWRMKALSKLSFSDFFYVLKLKIKEKIKF